MIRYTTLAIFLLSFSSVFSQDYYSQYSIVSGTDVRDMEADSFGNVYVVGRGTIQPSCLDTAASEYQGSAYLAKYDPIGNVIWRLNVEGAQGIANGLAIDPNGDIVVVGTSREGSQLNGIFVMKVSPNGEVIWHKTADGQSDDDEGIDIATGADGTIYVVGTFNFWVDFGNIELIGTNFNKDPFIWALRPEGFTKWAKQIPSGAASNGEDISVDSDGNIVVVSRINDLELRKLIIHISKYSPEGEELFVKKIPVSIHSKNYGLETDAQSNIYMTGYLSGFNGDSIDFDPGPGVHALYGSGQLWGDAYLLKLDKNGEFVWVIQTGDDRGPVSGRDIKIDDSGNIFTSGSFKNKVDFDPGPGVFEITTHPQGGTNYFQMFDSTGAFITARNGGSLNSSQGFGNTSLAIGQNGKVYLGREIHPGFHQGHIDVFGDCPVDFQREEIIACRKFELNGIEITSDCSIRTWLPDSTGCGTISTLNLEIIPEQDIQIRQTDTTLISNINTSSINWLDCNADFEVISGAEGNYIFQPEITGTYAAEIVFNGCRDTSDCVFFEVISTGIYEQESLFEETQIFPNPFSEKITIDNLPPAFAEISIFDLSGKLILEKEKETGLTEFQFSASELSRGVYAVFIKNEEGIFRKLISKI